VPTRADNAAMADAAAVRDQLASFPARLAAAARGVPQERPAPDEWAPSEVVRHLIAVEEEVWHRRLRQLETEEHPRWRWVEPGQWLGAHGADLESLLDVHARVRASTLAILRALGPDGWTRTGTHDTFGLLDVAGLMAVAADHDDEHLASLERATAADDRHRDQIRMNDHPPTRRFGTERRNSTPARARSSRT
jgi:DinB superfamily